MPKPVVETIPRERVPIGHPYRKVRMIRSTAFKWRRQADATDIRQSGSIAFRDLAPALDRAPDMLQLEQAKRGLELVQLAVEALVGHGHFVRDPEILDSIDNQFLFRA